MGEIILDRELDLDRVLEYAKTKHGQQLRADGSPYIEHPIRVSKLAEQYKKSKNIKVIMAACLLHDVLEDTYTSYRELVDEFGEIVASLVMEVSSASFMPKLIGKQTYLAQKMRYMSSYALVIKLCDRLDNISDLKGLPVARIQKTYYDTIYLVDELEDKRRLTESQDNLVTAIRLQLNKIKEQYNFD